MLGISEAFHPASHHQNNAERLAQLTRIQTFHVSLWSYLLEKLRTTPDGDGNLLDHSLVLYGGAMSNSNVHNHGPLPALVAGGAAGKMLREIIEKAAALKLKKGSRKKKRTRA